MKVITLKNGWAVEVVEFIGVEYQCPHCMEKEYTEPKAVVNQRTCPYCKNKYKIPDNNVTEDCR